jgi:hypothetical protein
LTWLTKRAAYSAIRIQHIWAGRERLRAASSHCSSHDAELHQHPIRIRKPRFSTESAHLFVAHVLRDLLSHQECASSISFSFLPGNAIGAVYEKKSETAFAISPGQYRSAL